MPASAPGFAEIIDLLSEVAGDDLQLLGTLGPATSLGDPDLDLDLSPVGLARLATTLQARFGPEIDIAAWLGATDPAGIRALTIGAVVDFVDDVIDLRDRQPALLHAC